MITIKLQGGLGNQMFQIATSFAHSRKLGTRCAFDFKGCHTPFQGHTSEKYKGKFFKHWDDLYDISEIMPSTTVNWSEVGFKYSAIPLSLGDNVRLHGYYQSEKYFNNYKEELKYSFSTFSEDTLANVGSFLNKHKDHTLTFVHVRRGDYLNKEDFHFNLGKSDYYEKAMEEIGDNGRFIFISDDIEWCKDNFNDTNIYYSPFKNELDDLYLMTQCDNCIIANSSLSWWGAWLKKSKYGKVVAPNNWFGPKGPKDTQDLIPKKWIKI